MRNEIYKDGILIDVIETPDEETEIENTETTFSIPQTAIESLQTQLADPATNTIAKMKLAFTEFLQELRG